MTPREAGRSVGTRAMDEALWVLLRNVPVGARRNYIIRGLALGAPRKPGFFS